MTGKDISMPEAGRLLLTPIRSAADIEAATEAINALDRDEMAAPHGEFPAECAGRKPQRE